ncbi:MAG: peptidoglycan-binding protein [Acidobacteriota bacterium]|nr:peptidoglycan-binding protein [Acidobacteriota bacterium]
MHTRKTVLALTLLLMAGPAFGLTHVRRGPTSPHYSSRKSKSVSHRLSGQAGIDPARATEIQSALIKSGYLTGQPSGVWDAQTQAAMQKLQADNGWQTKLVPDSRAIIKLGLGPGTATEQSSVTPDVIPTTASN